MSRLFTSGGQSIGASPSNEYSGLISFRMDWFDLLAVQGTLNSLLQHHSSKTSILWRSAFFMVQLSHPYMTTRKTIALIIWTFISKVVSLPFNTLFRFVIAFLPRNKHLLISWLSMKRQKDRTLKDELPRLVGAQYATGEEWRNNSRKIEEMEQKQKQHPVVGVTGDGSKVQYCKEQYCIGT